MIKEILDRFDNETEVDRTTAFKAALNSVMRQVEEEKKSLEGIAATLTVLLEKVLDEEQNMEGPVSYTHLGQAAVNRRPVNFSGHKNNIRFLFGVIHQIRKRCV